MKPSRIVLKDEIITVRKPPVCYTFRVIEPVENRVSAKIVSQYIENLTPETEIAKLDIRQAAGMVRREKGAGRPTKKERRLIDRLKQDAGEV